MEYIKQHWRKLLQPMRFVVSGGLLCYLIWYANPQSIWEVWRTIDMRWVAIALLLQLIGIILSSAKWGVILATRGQYLSQSWLLGVYLAGQFANNFLPTTVGGDAVRTVQLRRRIGSYSQAAASIFLERLTGFLALSLIANIALILTVSQFVGTQFINLYGITLLFTLVAVLAVVASFFAPRFEHQIGQYLPTAIHHPLQHMAQALSDYFPQGRSLVSVIWLSLLFQIVWILVHVACGIALGIDVPFLLYALIATITDILGLAPIFVNNLGAREFVFTLYLGQVGVPPETAIALALTIFAVRMLISLLGGLIIFFGGADFHGSVPPNSGHDTITKRSP